MMKIIMTVFFIATSSWATTGNHKRLMTYMKKELKKYDLSINVQIPNDFLERYSIQQHSILAEQLEKEWNAIYIEKSRVDEHSQDLWDKFYDSWESGLITKEEFNSLLSYLEAEKEKIKSHYSSQETLYKQMKGQTLKKYDGPSAFELLSSINLSNNCNVERVELTEDGSIHLNVTQVKDDESTKAIDVKLDFNNSNKFHTTSNYYTSLNGNLVTTYSVDESNDQSDQMRLELIHNADGTLKKFYVRVYNKEAPGLSGLFGSTISPSVECFSGHVLASNANKPVSNDDRKEEPITIQPFNPDSIETRSPAARQD